ncbi:MAG TPA: 5'/3'-nucleotidase SurE [Nitrospiraceae bacterium]|nr:5'/3'-nucleotidase SurE [Nitrospiraceae bacterium]
MTNDDGITAPGLHALAAIMKKVGTVYVVAPERERGAVGHSLTLHKPLRINRVGTRMFSVNGTPSDCVTLAVKRVLPAPPALVISGINRGVNLGDDVTYSGTVSAALEGTLLGLPSVAISQEGKARFLFQAAAVYALRVARAVLHYGLPDETLLNVNVPNRRLAAIAGVRITSLSRRHFVDPVVEKVDPRGRTYYWIAGTRVSRKRQKSSDYEAVRRGMVSVTPLHVDMTHYEAMGLLQNWENLLGTEKRKRWVRQSTGGKTPVCAVR